MRYKPPKGTPIDYTIYPANKLIGCWDFLEGIGDRTNDGMPGRNTGILSGFSFPATVSSGWNPGKFGRNLVFDGTNDYVNITNTVNAVQTISFWAKPSSTTERFLQIGTLISIYLQSGVVMAYGLDSSTIYVDGVNTTTFPNDGRWHNITVVGASSVTGNDINIGLEALNGGVNLDFNALYYAQAANNTVHDLITQDVAFWAWIKIDIDSGGVNKFILNKGNYQFYYNSTYKVSMWFNDGVDTYTVYGNTALNDNKLHFVCGVLDRSNASNCKVYVDGVNDTLSRSGVLANLDSLTSATILTLGQNFDGQIREVGIAYPADIMAADEMGASGEILYMATHPFDKANYCNYEDYWGCTDGSGTTVTGDVNNLTLTNAAAWSTEGQYYAGQIDLVRLFSIPLTQGVIRQLYKNPFGIYRG